MKTHYTIFVFVLMPSSEYYFCYKICNGFPIELSRIKWQSKAYYTLISNLFSSPTDPLLLYSEIWKRWIRLSSLVLDISGRNWGQILSPWLRDIVDYGIGLSNRHASLCSLVGRYTKTLCHSRQYSKFPSQGLKFGLCNPEDEFVG